jgi:ABC-type oligopeptide transport system substrate-binding subunit
MTQDHNRLLAYAQKKQVGLNVTPFNGFYFIGFNYNMYLYNNTFFRRAIKSLINY